MELAELTRRAMEIHARYAAHETSRDGRPWSRAELAQGVIQHHAPVPLAQWPVLRLGRLGQGGVKGGEFLREDGTQRRSDLPPLPSHYLGEFV